MGERFVQCELFAYMGLALEPHVLDRILVRGSNFRLRLKGRKVGGDAQEFLRFVTLSGFDLSRV